MTSVQLKKACKDAGVIKAGRVVYKDILEAIEGVIAKHGANPDIACLFRVAIREIEAAAVPVSMFHKYWNKD